MGGSDWKDCSLRSDTATFGRNCSGGYPIATNGVIFSLSSVTHSQQPRANTHFSKSTRRSLRSLVGHLARTIHKTPRGHRPAQADRHPRPVHLSVHCCRPFHVLESPSCLPTVSRSSSPAGPADVKTPQAIS